MLQHLEIVDIVVTDENLHSAFLFDRAIDGTDGQGARATGARICIIRMSTAPDVRNEVDLMPADGHPPAANWKKPKMARTNEEQQPKAKLISLVEQNSIHKH